MYWLESDTFAEDPLWSALAGGSPAKEDALQAAYCRLQSTAAHMRSDGFLTGPQALKQCRGRRQLLDLLASKALADRAPRLHRQGDQCECLEGVEWRDGYEYMIHRFLKRNPSKAENRRNTAQKADLRDARLKRDVYERDGGCCRYCRSGPLPRKGMGRARDRRKVLQYDHVDPDRPAGPDATNLVTSCARCNEHKGRRTPAEADMVLLPAPTPEQAAEWAGRGMLLRDLPDNDGSTTDEQATQQPTHALSNKMSDSRHSDDATTSPEDVSAGEVCPDDSLSTALTDATTTTTSRGEGAGSGRVGKPVGASVDDLGQQPRSSAAPDIYHRRSRPPPREPPAPPHPPPAPDEGEDHG